MTCRFMRSECSVSPSFQDCWHEHAAATITVFTVYEQDLVAPGAQIIQAILIYVRFKACPNNSRRYSSASRVDVNSCTIKPRGFYYTGSRSVRRFASLASAQLCPRWPRELTGTDLLDGSQPVWWSDKIRRVLLWLEIAACWRVFKEMSDDLD